MIILNQKADGFIIVGKGCSFLSDGEIRPEHSPQSTIFAYTGGADTGFILGTYDNYMQSKKVIKDIYDSIGNGNGKYKMPSREIVSRNLTRDWGSGTSIDVMKLSVRSYNCLKHAGIKTVEDLLSLSDDEILSIRNIGRSCFSEIKAETARCKNELNL